MFDHAARDAATRRQPDDRNVRGRRARGEQTVRLFHLFRTERRIEQDQAGQVVRGLDDGFEARARQPHAEAGRRQLSLSGSDEVPAGFRQAIEEYYKKLAQRGTK